MIMQFISILLPFFLMAKATESTVDLRMAVDPIDAKNRSHIDILSQTTFDMGPCSLLVNPEIDFYFNKSVDFGLSLGHRWALPYGALGHHIYFDRSQLPKLSVNQIGTGIDYLTPYVDFRLNYYQPLSGIFELAGYKFKPCKWIEGEALLKTPFANFGIGPSLNFDNQVWGAQGRVIFPFERFSLGVGSHIDQRGNSDAFLCTSFHLYKDKNGDPKNQVASHNKRPKIEFYPIKPPKKKFDEADKVEEKKPEYVEITDPDEVENQLEKDKEKGVLYLTDEGLKTLKQIEDESLPKEVAEVIEESVAPPQIPPAPETKTVWESICDFFLGTRNG